MKKFKIVDCWVSAILITGSFIYGFISRNFNFIAGYFIVGGWQLISIATHYLTDTFIGKARNNYTKLIGWATVSLFSLFIVALAWEPLYGLLLIALLLVLIISPLMAIYYTYLCFEETYMKMKRPLALLK